MLLTAAVLAVCGSTEAVGQGPGTIVGTVRAAESGEPLVGATVSVEGTAVSATTAGAGRYRLLNLASGTHRLRVEQLGYATLVEEVAVYSDRMTVVQFRLPLLTVLVDSLFVTGRAPLEPGPEVRVISLDDAPAGSLGDILDWATPGLDVRRGSGQVGSGISIRVRGSTSLSLPGTPLVYIDGIRVESTSGWPGLGVGGPTVFDLVDVGSIERIEVLRGPEAALYGLGSINGVILITTKGRR